MRRLQRRLLTGMLFLLLGGLTGNAQAGSKPPASEALASTTGPACASGPERIGHTIIGTACADVIYAPASVTAVDGGAGNDTIIATPTAANAECPEPGCKLGVGSQTFEGGPGNDVVFGERGNDILRGGEGNDQLYGGIGDDLLEGGPGNDLLSGGFGADGIDGGPGNDFVRGDGTQDEIVDTGPETDTDTLSYATGVTPGFGNAQGYPKFDTEHSGFPSTTSERGVYLNLSSNLGDNGVAPNGGGVDKVEGADFERIIGSPFSDYIVGGSGTQTILGGAGADVLIAGPSGTKLKGGGDGDDCVGGVSDTTCESTAEMGKVVPRDPTKVSVGLMTPGEAALGPGEPGYSEAYLLGSSSTDEVIASYGTGSPATVTFELASGSFDEPSTSTGCVIESAAKAVCPIEGSLDSVLIAGLAGDDNLAVSGLPATTSLMLLGGDGNDTVSGGEESDDTLADGPGNDKLFGHNGDDALLNNSGRDEVFGEGGNDLFLSNSICDGGVLNGGPGRDNASWAKFNEPDAEGRGVDARLDLRQAGRPGPANMPQCGDAPLDGLEQIEDLEGSSLADVFYGDAGPNQLLGHLGPDIYFAGGGEDSILANSGDFDPVIDCGEGIDSAVIDRPQYGDVAAPDCENVFEADPNNFRALTRLRPAVAPSPPPPPDTTPPRTRVTSHPPPVIWTHKRTRRVVFRFASSEPSSRFRCKLDHKPYRACASPRSYQVALGRHQFHVVAIDASGNADPTPAVFAFRVRMKG